MNTNGINNLQNQYALYSGTTSSTGSATTTTTTQNTVSSTADTVTISPEALALQQAADTQNVIAPPTDTPSAGGGASARPPL